MPASGIFTAPTAGFYKGKSESFRARISLSFTSAGTRKAGRQAGKKSFVARQKKARHVLFMPCVR